MIRQLVLITLLTLSTPLAAQDTTTPVEVVYTVNVQEPLSGRVKVTMRVGNNRQEYIEITLPRWNPGSYRFQDHYKTIEDLTSKHGATQIAKSTWRIPAKKSGVTITYTVTVPRKRLDSKHFFFEAPSLYMYVVGKKEALHRVKFLLPANWKVATGLELRKGYYYARDYDTFIDCPTELGRFSLLEFQEDKVLYQLAIDTVGEINENGLVELCRKIVKGQNALFGVPPFQRYVFLFHFTNSWGGRGLEHLNSTNIDLSYNFIKNDIRNAASLISHEYYHLWNVKRIRPEALGPFDYTGMVRTRHLWVCEGLTSYYGDLTLARTGIWDESRYFRHLANEIIKHNNNPDRKVTSVEQASEKIWDNRPHPRVDYYNKGEVLGLLLDLKIRKMTQNEKSLDDVMRHLYDRYVVEGEGPIGVGFEGDGILKALNTVSGGDFTDFYARYIKGTDDLPFTDTLAEAGLNIQLTVVRTAELTLPLRRLVINNVPPKSAVEMAGLRAGDKLVKMNGEEVTSGSFRRKQRKLKVGEAVLLTFEREGDTFDIRVAAGEKESWACTIRRRENASPEQTELLNSWLGKK